MVSARIASIDVNLLEDYPTFLRTCHQGGIRLRLLFHMFREIVSFAYKYKGGLFVCGALYLSCYPHTSRLNQLLCQLYYYLTLKYTQNKIHFFVIYGFSVQIGCLSPIILAHFRPNSYT